MVGCSDLSRSNLVFCTGRSTRRCGDRLLVRALWPGSNANGGSFSAAVYANRWFGIAGDFGAYSQSPTKTYTFLAGPRFSVRARSRFTPYVETLFGDTHFTTSGFPSRNGFTALAGGGVELGMSRSVALRPQLDYLAIRSGGSVLNTARISVGLAFRIGSLPRQ